MQDSELPATAPADISSTNFDLASYIADFIARLTVSVPKPMAQAILHIGKTKLEGLVGEGKLDAVKNGPRTEITVESIKRLQPACRVPHSRRRRRPGWSISTSSTPSSASSPPSGAPSALCVIVPRRGVSNGRAGERDRRRNGRARQDVVSDWKTERVPHKPIANQNQGRRAELIGSNICTACGIRVRSTTPVLSICRRLIEAGYDADQALQV